MAIAVAVAAACPIPHSSRRCVGVGVGTVQSRVSLVLLRSSSRHSKHANVGRALIHFHLGPFQFRRLVLVSYCLVLSRTVSYCLVSSRLSVRPSVPSGEGLTSRIVVVAVKLFRSIALYPNHVVSLA